MEGREKENGNKRKKINRNMTGFTQIKMRATEEATINALHAYSGRTERSMYGSKRIKYGIHLRYNYV